MVKFNVTTAPKGGWKPKTYYSVDVMLYKGNVRHRAIFYSGFLDKHGKPAGYNCIMNPTYNGQFDHAYGRVHFMEVVKELDV